MNTYTLDEVKCHKSKDDCWIIVKDGIYDLTEFLSIHPGESGIIMSVAGQNATEYFVELHRPEILEEIGDDYLIGHLTNELGAIKYISRL